MSERNGVQHTSGARLLGAVHQIYCMPHAPDTRCGWITYMVMRPSTLGSGAGICVSVDATRAHSNVGYSGKAPCLPVPPFQVRRQFRIRPHLQF